MQPDRIKVEAGKAADKSSLENAEKARVEASKKIGAEVEKRANAILWMSAGVDRRPESEEEDTKVHTSEINTKSSKKRHGILRLFPMFRVKTRKDKTLQPVILGELTTPEGKTCTQTGSMEREWSGIDDITDPEHIDRITFRVGTEDSKGYTASEEYPLAVLEDGVLTVAEKWASDEVAISNPDDDALRLVNEILDKFEEQAKQPSLPFSKK